MARLSYQRQPSSPRTIQRLEDRPGWDNNFQVLLDNEKASAGNRNYFDRKVEKKSNYVESRYALQKDCHYSRKCITSLIGRKKSAIYNADSGRQRNLFCSVVYAIIPTTAILLQMIAGIMRGFPIDLSSQECWVSAWIWTYEEDDDFSLFTVEVYLITCSCTVSM